MTFNPEDKDKTAKAPPDPVNQPEQSEEFESPVKFMDKAIAFATLVLPYAYGLNWIVNAIEDHVPRQIYSLVMVAGIVGFLVLVGLGAHVVSRLRTGT
jgi:hypothetical protein